MAILTVSVGAASRLMPWNRFFLGLFDRVDPELADTVFQSVETSQTCGDVTVTVREAVMDQRAVWLLVDYQLPADTDMDQVRMNTVSPPLFDLYQGSVSWAELEGLTSHEAQNGPMQELNNLYLVETTSIETMDPETRTLTVLLYGRCDREPASGEPLTLFAWDAACGEGGNKLGAAGGPPGGGHPSRRSTPRSGRRARPGQEMSATRRRSRP